MKNNLDKAIIRRLQDELPLVEEPFREIADELGIDESVLLEKLRQYKEEKVLKRVAVILRHRKIGYNTNAMVVWEIPEDEVDRVADVMISYPMISHCYERTTSKDWNYNMYTMIHCESYDECNGIIDEIISKVGKYEYKILYSTKELKKTSVKYFMEQL